jgi:spore maturation protein CgeB
VRILLGHTFSDCATFGSAWIEDWLARLRVAGYEVYPFSLVYEQARPVIYFDELDALWRYRDPCLLEMYERLSNTLLDYDVFICFTGANVHPDFVRTLKCFTVYGCFDDPESSHKLSKPVAAAFDLAMVGNIAELDTYTSWGVKEVRWWPLGCRHDDYDPSLTERAILEGERDIEVALLCERVARYRKKRVDQFARAFPNGVYHGRGWPSGFLPEAQRVSTLQRTQIGINIHNSTGPINFRTFYLPANGVVQICDNKTHLGKVFELGVEAIGYDSIEEAIDLTRYYLDHDEERRRISVAGWKRAMSDYNEVACFKRVVDAVNDLKSRVDNKYCDLVQATVHVRYDNLHRLRGRVILTAWRGWYALRQTTRSAVRKFISKLTK